MRINKIAINFEFNKPKDDPRTENLNENIADDAL